MGRRLSDFTPEPLLHIPPADGQPGLALEWPADCQYAVDAAVARVERWFAERHKSSLWIALHIGRNEQQSSAQSLAYETAFLWRLQQRLMASDGTLLA
ncbi:LasR-specific antiactivator QslA [Pseudomonas sp. CAN2814]|uniref:LasR-specific antiactivator QslA n=1 Tax=Pseudomonas sp. CAN1 TaxID=3046726 RepID=UPI0026472383|nr:LasR-specific antiactivator QslA [Pseudomonas sp. CAN1]MDN6860186.1 LasR-specific antiactivator QslA [Pseudomonas sp. CAN1]